MLFNHDNFRGGGTYKNSGGGFISKNQGPPGTLDSALPVKCKKLMILLIIIDLFSCYVHKMRRINAFIETNQRSELHKSLMGLSQISIVSLFFLFLETSSQFSNYGMGFNG